MGPLKILAAKRRESNHERLALRPATSDQSRDLASIDDRKNVDREFPADERLIQNRCIRNDK